MKTNTFLAMMICFSFLFSTIGCEKAEVQKPSINGTATIEPRSEDCSNCPPEDCCCEVISGNSGVTNLVFCGTTNPEWSSSQCSVDLVDPCPDINGYYWFASLVGQNDSEHFCVAKNSSFMIGVASAANLTLSCQVGQTSPQIINLSLSAGQKLYYTVDNNCALSTCHPE